MQQEGPTCQGDEAQSVHARLHHLPEVHVLMVEDVAVGHHVEHELRGQRHTHIIPTVYVPHQRREEALHIKAQIRLLLCICIVQKIPIKSNLSFQCGPNLCAS